MSKKQQNSPLRGLLNWRALLENENVQAIAFAFSVIGCFIALLYLIYVGIGVLPRFAELAYQDDKENLRTVVIVLGGVIAFPFAIWRLYISDKQANASREQARIAQEAHFTSLFTKAVELLGSTRERKEGERIVVEPNIEVRLGAIYALERIAQDSERDRWPILECLCAYVRSNAPVPQHYFWPHDTEHGEANFAEHDVEKWLRELKPMDITAKAVIRVIGRLPHDKCNRLDLRLVNFSGVELNQLNFENADLDHSVFLRTKMAKTNFCGSSFRGSLMRFVHAPKTSFEDCNFYKALVDQPQFSHASFVSASLVEFQLNMLKLEWGADEPPPTLFMKVDFTNAKFSQACLCDADLSFAIGLTEEQVRSMDELLDVKLPADIKIDLEEASG